MKLTNYQLGAAAVLVLLAVIAVFVQRSNWNRDRYILSADNAGNLKPVSEKYFEDKQKAFENRLNIMEKKVAPVWGFIDVFNGRTKDLLELPHNKGARQKGRDCSGSRCNGYL